MKPLETVRPNDGVRLEPGRPPSIGCDAIAATLVSPARSPGTYSEMAQEITLARVVQTGVVPMDTATVCSEIQRSWSRLDAAEWSKAYSNVFPLYQLLIKSYEKGRQVGTNHEKLDSERK
jgi:hypothetical protein